MSSSTLTAAAQSCAHCRQPLDAAAIEGRFCCSGCAGVFALLQGQGLSTYYRLAPEAPRPAPRPTGREYTEFSDPGFLARYARELPGGGRAIDLRLEGVHCGACAWLVERLPRVLPGVESARLDLGRARADVHWDPARTDLTAIARQLDRMGYPPQPFRAGTEEDAQRREDRAALVRLAVAGALAGNVMLMAFALYSGELASMSPAFRAAFRWGCLALTLPAVFGPGAVFLRGALAGLRARALGVDVPVSLGMLAGLVAGTVNTLRGVGDIYFDTVCVLVFLLLCGRWLERRQRRHLAKVGDPLQTLIPTSARRVVDGEPREVYREALRPEDVVRVLPGERFPVDGEVLHGSSEVDASVLTGESRPQPARPGARVFAGTRNLSWPVDVRVEAAGEATRVGKLLEAVTREARARVGVVKLADRVAGYFVFAVLLASLAVGLGWWSTSPSLAIDHAVALLIVTCPCALGLATPLAVGVALGRAARRGLLIGDGDVFERLAQPGRVWLDKTGTLTAGRPTLLAWEGPEWVQPLVLALEQGSTHQLARAFREAWPCSPARGAEVEHGPRGVEGRIDGRVVRVGSPAWLVAEGAPTWWRAFVDQALAAGGSPIAVEVDGELVAGAAFGDPLREDAPAVVDALRRQGWRVGILSGDHPGAVAHVARALSLAPEDCHGGLSPDDKLAHVKDTPGTVLMVGDGVNDALALAAASVGVGLRGGAEGTLTVAHVYATRDELSAVLDLLEVARSARRVVRRNLRLSLAYNLLAASLAAAGWIRPLLAAVLMPLSSLSVLGSSAQAGRTP
ncbi:MAG: heavy metal translocating P-type ATPase metal-binding domain-containing protein [Planctomycetes bacterium]|nr:heavy metal translocating P-type ATPase metal-binding domain-containing protein [Planctomycetota bacterium]